ncbi:hypothetical protein S7335_1261 [Synechococcus sp. PCC 7335]|uniref:hypothetical protein n=1 Tax=Synechococcus sp. (strain ATCC 29403 / PCC 7335) TaxID=91464 RepID=UPI00017EB932|nr:hypothetical protein [Synechococcus sp. PCC 7335]EDX82557.1 hypothetical protein S7335_1261 [Synechococcus sp. PCC 7335]
MPRRGRPGGNPGIAEYEFTKQHDWSESCTAVKTIKLPPMMSQALKDGLLPEWQEICRQAIASKLPSEIAKALNWPIEEEVTDE